jgi:hypothetical protein
MALYINDARAEAIRKRTRQIIENELKEWGTLPKSYGVSYAGPKGNGLSGGAVLGGAVLGGSGVSAMSGVDDSGAGWASGLLKLLKVPSSFLPVIGPAMGPILDVASSVIGEGHSGGKRSRKRTPTKTDYKKYIEGKGVSGGKSKQKQRGALVSKLMKEHHFTLGEASKYIKAKGLM